MLEGDLSAFIGGFGLFNNEKEEDSSSEESFDFYGKFYMTGGGAERTSLVKL